MSPAELAYLIMVLCAFAVFVVTLAWVDWNTNRRVAEKPGRTTLQTHPKRASG